MATKRPLGNYNGTAGELQAGDSLSVGAYTDLDVGGTPAPPPAAAGVFPDRVRVYAVNDSNSPSLEYQDKVGQSIRLARDQIITVRNASGITLPKGCLVYISGAIAGVITVAAALADSKVTAPAVGMLLETLTANQIGRCCIGGLLVGVNTSGYSEGSSIYLSNTVPGGFQGTAPVVGFSQKVGFIITSHASLGRVLLKPDTLSPRQNVEGFLHINEATSTPVTPAEGSVIFSKVISNRRLPAFKSPGGGDSAIQPFLARSKVGYWNPSGNSTRAPGVFGFTTPVVIGKSTPTARAVSTVNKLSRMRRLGYVSASKLNSIAGLMVNVAQFTTGNGAGAGGFHWLCRFGVSDVTLVAGATMFIGLTSSISKPVVVEPSLLLNCIGVGQSAVNGGNTLVIVSAGTVPNAIIDLGAGFPLNNSTAYELSLFSPSDQTGVIHWQVTNLSTDVTASGSITGGAVNLPQSNTLLATQVWRSNNATTTPVGIDVCSIYVETDD